MVMVIKAFHAGAVERRYWIKYHFADSSSIHTYFAVPALRRFFLEELLAGERKTSRSP